MVIYYCQVGTVEVATKYTAYIVSAISTKLRVHSNVLATSLVKKHIHCHHNCKADLLYCLPLFSRRDLMGIRCHIIDSKFDSGNGLERPPWAVWLMALFRRWWSEALSSRRSVTSRGVASIHGDTTRTVSASVDSLRLLTSLVLRIKYHPLTGQRASTNTAASRHYLLIC